MSLKEELLFGKRFEYVAAEAYVAKRWPGAQLVEAPAYSDLDFAVIKPQESGPPVLAAFLEVKTRRIDSAKYDSTIVAWRKYDAARFGRAFFKVPTVCLVVFTDAVATFDLHDLPDGKQKIGRFDRPGTEVDHALYLHSRFEWHPELLEPILERANAVNA